MKVREGLLRYIAPSTPVEERLKAARRLSPDPPQPPLPPLPPHDLATVLFVLSHDKDKDVSEAARKSLGDMTPSEVLSALAKKLDPLVIRKILSMHGGNEAVMTIASTNPGIDDETLMALAEKGPEEAVEVIAGERERILKNPSILSSLKKNPLSSKLIISALEDYLSNPSQARAPQAQRRADDEEVGRRIDEEFVDEMERPEKHSGDQFNIYKIVAAMNFAQKIKLALTGNKTAREFFAKDTNKIIAGSVLKNPRITEDEILKIASSKNTADDILRQVAQHKEWMKNYNIKISMATNPKTPVSVSVRLLDYLLEKDLEGISKSKNIPSVLASTARRKLDAKKRH